MVKLRLQEAAKAKGLNMSQVQRQSGLTMTMVRRYWHNQVHTVSLDALGELARVLDVAPGELLEEVKIPAQK